MINNIENEDDDVDDVDDDDADDDEDDDDYSWCGNLIYLTLKIIFSLLCFDFFPEIVKDKMP